AQLLVEMGAGILEPDAQARDRAAQAPGSSEAADQATHRTEHSHQQEQRLALLADNLAFLRGGFHDPAVDAEQLLAGLQELADRVSIDPAQQVVGRGPGAGLAASGVQLAAIAAVASADLVEELALVGKLGESLGRGQRRLELVAIVLED